MTAETIKNRIRQLLADTESHDDNAQLVDDAVYTQSMTAGLREFSLRDPEATTDTVAMVTGTYEYSLPSDWDDEVSNIVSIEYPSGDQNPVYIDTDDYLVGLTTWRFLYESPTTGESAIVNYTRPWTATSLPDYSLEPVAYFGAASVARSLAARYGRTENRSISADVVDYRSKADQWRAIARDFQAQGYRLMGINMTRDGRIVEGPVDTSARWGWHQL